MCTDINCIGDYIYSSPFATVGSIGVIATVPNFYERLKEKEWRLMISLQVRSPVYRGAIVLMIMYRQIQAHVDPIQGVQGGGCG